MLLENFLLYYLDMRYNYVIEKCGKISSVIFLRYQTVYKIPTQNYRLFSWANELIHNYSRSGSR